LRLVIDTRSVSFLFLFPSVANYDVRTLHNGIYHDRERGRRRGLAGEVEIRRGEVEE
jgi:hypothetical protein